MQRLERSALLRGSLLLLLGVAPIGLSTGCDDDFGKPNIQVPDPGPTVEVFATPEISFDPTDGTTTVVVQFVARDPLQVPLGEDDLFVDLFVDGQVIDVEGILQQDSEDLSANLHLSLVLDASYSMLQHDPSAFGPMLTAARRTVNEARTLYFDRPGVFDWSLVWFDNLVHEPLVTSSEQAWTETDIERVPVPEAGTFTKFYAALDAALRSEVERLGATPPGPRDRSIVVAFTDGADNYSWYDNGDLTPVENTITPNRRYVSYGYTPIDRPAVTDLLSQNGEIQMHVIGLGSAVNDADLAAVASAGGGRYFKNPDPSRVDALFDQVIGEFTSVQSHGATIPLPPGQYDFKVRVRRAGSDARTDYDFRFVGGQVGARVLD